MRSPVAPLVAGPSYRLYVANAGNNSITVYHANASGNAAPIATIVGANTQLNAPGQLSEDAEGNLYVANVVSRPGSAGASSILVFAHGANGNVAPIRVIGGPLTDLNGLQAVTVDQTDGKIFAAATTTTSESELLRFPPNASGNQAPLAESQGKFGWLNQIASDSTGKHIIESSIGVDSLINPSYGVYTLKKQFPSGATLSPIYSIVNFVPSAIADDPMTKTYLVSGDDGVTQGIFRFQEDTVGHGQYDGGGPPSYTPGVVSVITTVTCGNPVGDQLAVGHDRSIYVVCGTDDVYVFAHDASGNAAPLRVVTGSATQLYQPTGIYEGK